MTSIFKRLFSVTLAAVLILSCAFAGLHALAAGVVNTGDGNNTVSLTFSPAGGGMIYYKIGSTDSRTLSRYTNTHAVGTPVELTAAPRNAAEFLYWYNVYTDRVFSFDETVTFTLSTATQLYALFSEPDANFHYVAYLNYAGSIIYSNDVPTGQPVPVPSAADASVPGFTFLDWSMTSTQVQQSATAAVVRPRYTVDNRPCTLSLTNAQNVSGAGQFPLYDTVYAKADGVNGSGQPFSCWKDASGAIVSYERNYTFRITKNVTLTAVYGGSVTPEPVIRISDIAIESPLEKVTFFAERSIPDGHTLIQHGILLTSTSAELVVSAAGLGASAAVKRGTGISNESCGTYSLSKAKAVSGTVYRARAYAICENPQGVQMIYYSTVETASF
ncbi:MAG: hypothetical protein FWF05_03845 [Oscillospiraceae bacterium]|nr:hypothetical protein [Oscillospiraceae bacterium]